MNKKNQGSLIGSVLVFGDDVILLGLEIVTMDRFMILLEKEVLLLGWRDELD
jgi:hypothetical protein